MRKVKPRLDTNIKCSKTGLTSNPLILNRVVEKELIANLYEMSSRELDKTIDARYGNGKCSPDFNLFHDSRSIIKSVAEDLTKIMMEAVKSEVYIIGSFFNIFSAALSTALLSILLIISSSSMRPCPNSFPFRKIVGNDIIFLSLTSS